MWSEEEFQAWKARPETQAFLKWLGEAREVLKDAWAEGAEMSPKNHMRAVVYGELIDLKYRRDILGEDEEEEDDDDDEPGSN